MGREDVERVVVAAVPAITYRADGDGAAWRFTSVQGGLLDLLGVTAEALCDDPSRWVLMVHREDRERVLAERLRAGGSGRLEVEYRLRAADGADCWIREVAVRDGLSDGMCGLVIDLTEHRRADDVLEQLHDARLTAITGLLRAASLRDTTLQLFVHDIRSPLTAIAGLAKTLEERGKDIDPKDRDRILGRVAAASDRVVALVDDFARFWCLPLESTVPAERVRLAPLVLSAVAEVGVEGDVEIEVGDVVVETHPQLLRRVLVGLVRNAVEHTPGRTLIRVTAVEEPDGVVLDVEDDGPGIPEELRGHMFEPLVRGADGGNGMGIGLTLVQAAVGLLGGAVRALANPSGGTIMRVELPSVARTAAA